jgi:hypothetical protein
MSTVVTGRNVNIRAKVEGDYITIGCSSSCSFEFENEIIGKTDVNAGLFRKKRVRISDCRGSVSGIMITESEATRLSIFHFMQEAIRRSEVDLQFVFEDTSGNVKIIQGLFIIATIGLSSDIQAFGEFDLQFEGTGGIVISSIDPPPDVVCETIFSDWWTTTPGESGISGTGHAGRSFAGHDVIEVDREGLEHDIVTTGTPGNRQAKYTGGSTITFDPANPFNAGEIIFVIWVEDGS